jgi:ribonuclease P protein component
VKQTSLCKIRSLSHKEYQLLYRSGKKSSGKYLLIFYRLGDQNESGLGITISRKWGNAPKRNRFKRVVRAAYAAIYQDLPVQLKINIHPKPDYQTLTMQIVKQELNQLITKIREYSQQRTKTGY